MNMERALGNAFFKERRTGWDGTLLLVLVTVRRSEIAAIYRTINGNFALRAAANGADFFRLCRAKAAFLSLLTNWTRQARSPGRPRTEEYREAEQKQNVVAKSSHDHFVMKAPRGDYQ